MNIDVLFIEASYYLYLRGQHLINNGKDSNVNSAQRLRFLTLQFALQRMICDKYGQTKVNSL